MSDGIVNRSARAATTPMPAGRAGRRITSRARSDGQRVARAAAEADWSSDGAGARAAQAPEGMPMGGTQPGVGALLLSPAPESLAEIRRVEPEGVADVAEAARPVALFRPDPLLRLTEQTPAASAAVGDVALEGDDGFLQHRQKEPLLGDDRCVRRAASSRSNGQHGSGLELQATARRLAAPTTRCVHGRGGLHSCLPWSNLTTVP